MYSIGLYTSEAKLAALRKDSASGSGSGSAAAAAAAARLAALSGNGVALLLTFQMAVDRAKVVDAFVSALGAGDAAYNKARDGLQELLTAPLQQAGKDKYGKGDTIEFVFQGASKLVVVVNGGKKKVLDSPKLRAKLMAVYTGEGAVAPELVRQFQALF